ncbi:hypothetical protein L2712_17430 [Shewanella marisflavi]|uniref:hypothetical protein n=1 Tax=Shewanella marisflavi TaxID=260364 RepID=UPI00200F2AC7|nr:hypothetical protein [Shewanella marisflavi]
MNKFTLFTLSLLLAFSAQSEVYRCTDGVYQADPCDEDSKPVDLSGVGSVVSNDAAPAYSHLQSNLGNGSDKKAQISTYVRNQQIEREINKLENRRERVIANRDRRMANLRNRGRWANNNLAGATWQQSLAQEMSAITQQADTEVSSIDRQIAQLKTEMR